jgi:hypothetical protein
MTRGPWPFLRRACVLACLVAVCAFPVGCDDVALVAPTDPGSLTNLSVSGYYRNYPGGVPSGTVNCRTTVRRTDGSDDYVSGLTIRVGDHLLSEASTGVYEGGFMDMVGGDRVRFVVTNGVDSLVLRTSIPYVATDVSIAEVTHVWDFEGFGEGAGCNTVEWDNPDTLGESNWVSAYALDAGGDRLQSALMYPGTPYNEVVVCNDDFSGTGDLADAESVRVQVGWDRIEEVPNPPYGTTCIFTAGAVTWDDFDVAAK